MAAQVKRKIKKSARVRVKVIHTDPKQKLLLYLIGVAQKTKGAEVWRALFAEILANQSQ
jgi:hypothetical protein